MYGNKQEKNREAALCVFHWLVEEVFTVFFLALLKTIFGSSPLFLCPMIGEQLVPLREFCLQIRLHLLYSVDEAVLQNIGQFPDNYR
jgi:hypothetical protein